MASLVFVFLSEDRLQVVLAATLFSAQKFAPQTGANKILFLILEQTAFQSKMKKLICGL